MAASRFGHEAGIAIGPILFIIAILAILAAAIAAGSGSFTSGTATESNKTKASAIIQIGENLKIGMDRVLMENDATFSSVVINANNTSETTDLFSPTGGGITLPSNSLANDPTTDYWQYPVGAIPQVGSSAQERLAMLAVSVGVCDEINSRADGLPSTPAAADIGDPVTGDLDTNVENWPPELKGKIIGCVHNNNATASGYWFYQVLAVQ